MADPMHNEELFASLLQSEADPNEARSFDATSGGLDAGMDDRDVELDDEPDDAELGVRPSGRRAMSGTGSVRSNAHGAPRSARDGRSSSRPSGLAERAVLGVGDVVDGKYRVERVVGRRGSGLLVEATHVDLGQTVTIRHPPREVRARPAVVARFLRQARAACQIQSEHAARILDVGRLDSGVPYLVMEGLKGWDLEEVLRVRGPLPVEDAVDYLVQACEAVAEAHGIGILHRSLSLSNLVLTRRLDGSALVKVVDFGVPDVLQSIPFAEMAISESESSVFLSLRRFLSPEQVRAADDVDVRADVWALGAVLQELLTGAPTFYGETPAALLASVAADAPRTSSTVLRGVPPEMEAIVLRCLAKDRTARFQSVAEFVTALRPFTPADSLRTADRISRLSLPAHSRPPPLPSSRSSVAMVPVSRSSKPPPPKNPFDRPSATLFGAVAIVGILLGGFLGVMGTGRIRTALEPPTFAVQKAAPPETPGPVVAAPPAAPPAKAEAPTSSFSPKTDEQHPPLAANTAPAPSAAPQRPVQSVVTPKADVGQATAARETYSTSKSSPQARPSASQQKTSPTLAQAVPGTPKSASRASGQAPRDLFDDTR